MEIIMNNAKHIMHCPHEKLFKRSNILACIKNEKKTFVMIWVNSILCWTGAAGDKEVCLSADKPRPEGLDGKVSGTQGSSASDMRSRYRCKCSPDM